jgi:hypothetical protein
MKHLSKYLGLIILLTIFGCAQNPDSVSMEMAGEEVVAPTTEQKTSETVERKLIKEGRVEFETDNLNSIRKTPAWRSVSLRR